MSLPIIYCMCQVCMINKRENMRSLNFVITLFSILQWREKIGANATTTDDNCTAPENIEKCMPCTNQNKSDPSYDRNCFRNGVHHIFFQCSNSEDSLEFSCDSDIEGRYLHNFLSVIPGHNQKYKHNQGDWKCYFDITNGKKSSEHRARFLISDSAACSNSTIFKIYKKSKDSKHYDIKVHSGSIPGKKYHNLA